MATKYWRGTAAAVAQVARATITAYDATTTYKVTIGGVTISQIGTGGTVSTTATALVALLNASTDPRFSQITWTANAVAGSIDGTADTAGMPFVFSTSVSGGAGTFGAYGVTTANAGPNDWSTAYNWSDGVVPVNGDTVYIQDVSTNICWGLDQSAVTLAALIIKNSFTGYIGLPHYTMAASADGNTVTTVAANEYRDTYLKISSTLTDIGYYEGPATVNGSQRIKIDFGSVTTQAVTVWNTASSGKDGFPAVLLLCNHNTFILNVRNAPGGVGVAMGIPGETSTLATVNVMDRSSASRVYTGDGVTLTTWNQYGGDNVARAVATMTTQNVYGGTLTTEGSYAVTTLNLKGGVYYANSTGTITTINFTSGLPATLDSWGNSTARTWTTLNKAIGATIRKHANVTITTPVEPTVDCTVVCS